MDSSSVYALSAGFLAAAGSLSAKLTLGADYLREMCESGLSGWTQGPGGATRCDWHDGRRPLTLQREMLLKNMFREQNPIINTENNWMGKDKNCCVQLHVPLRLLCGVLLLSCNTLMWTMFSKALRHGSSSAGVTVTTTASNFISSAVIGRLIFGETHSTLWWTGISLTLCGLLVLHSATPQTSPQEIEKKDK